MAGGRWPLTIGRYMTSIQRIHLLSQFSCLGDKCPDTCCRGWSMQVDEKTLARYKDQAPELMAAVEPGEAEDSWIMKKDKASGYCVKLESGLCGIQKQHGAAYLSDACHSYPRVTRKLGDTIIMTAGVSCPEIARLMLEEENALALENADVERLPSTIKDYLPAELTSAQALETHRVFLAATEDASVSAEHIFARIASVSRSLERIGKKNWPQAAAMYFRLADGALPPPETHPADPFNLLHALAGLIVASHKPMSQRLKQTVSDMEKALCVTLDWENVTIEASEKSAAAYRRIKAAWQNEATAEFDTILRKWLAMQLSLTLHPFAGLGENISERMTILGVKFATFKLALMCACDTYDRTQREEFAPRIAQSLARFLDHLGDAAFSLRIYNETGWTKEARMRGLLES